MDGLYERDFYSWAMGQAALLRAGRLEALDCANLAEELESLGRSEASALKSAYRLLLMHLLKWTYQPEKRTASWRITMARTRVDITDILDDNPGLKSRRAELFAKAYKLARQEAAAETDLPLEHFPEECPWGIAEVES